MQVVHEVFTHRGADHRVGEEQLFRLLAAADVGTEDSTRGRDTFHTEHSGAESFGGLAHASSNGSCHGLADHGLRN